MSYLKSKLPESLPAETVRGSWRQQLLNAAEYIRVHGHCQNTFEDRSGAVCAWGALDRVASNALYGDALMALQLHVGNIAEWNDAPGRTASEVIAALEGAARSALREGGGG